MPEPRHHRAGDTCESRALCAGQEDRGPDAGPRRQPWTEALPARASLGGTLSHGSKIRTLNTVGVGKRQCRTQSLHLHVTPGGRQNQSRPTRVDRRVQSHTPHLWSSTVSVPRHSHVTGALVSQSRDGLAKTSGSARQGPARVGCPAPRCCHGCRKRINYGWRLSLSHIIKQRPAEGLLTKEVQKQPPQHDSYAPKGHHKHSS